MREPPRAPGLDTLRFVAAPHSVTLPRSYKLITPLFGGGVAAGENDREMLIRGASIRGQLRFWWRATRGGRFGNGPNGLRDMKAAEDLLWGAASKRNRPRPSQVQVAVKIENRGVAVAIENVPAYAAFALRENGQTNALRGGIEFTLTLTYPTGPASPTFPDGKAKEVEAALWAWETFGGIGARTRRGFGALQRMDDNTEKPANPNEVLNCLNERLNHYGVSGTWPNSVPHLPPVFGIGTNFKISGQGQSERVWTNLIGNLKNFRQERNPGIAPNRPGRSRWTEPDEVRRLTGRIPPAHAVPIYAPRIQKFPRAAFGLPIIFHFIGAGEPNDTTLQGVHHDRLSSPLILRPLACANNNQAVGLAVILEAPRLPPGGVKLQGATGNPVVNTSLNAIEAAALMTSAGTPLLKEHIDVLQAFLATL